MCESRCPRRATPRPSPIAPIRTSNRRFADPPSSRSSISLCLPSIRSSAEPNRSCGTPTSPTIARPSALAGRGAALLRACRRAHHRRAGFGTAAGRLSPATDPRARPLSRGSATGISSSITRSLPAAWLVLILSWIHCQNLAPCILAPSSRRLPDGWQARYSYHPVVLETRVERPSFIGTCYKAAHWQCLGDTQRAKLDTPSPRKACQRPLGSIRSGGTFAGISATHKIDDSIIYRYSSMPHALLMERCV